ncbi:MAG: hypothetical protein EB078_02950 [Proteobacteria bacterium]|nr:hypothetical protein [Pseudomonadota bacterium]NDD03841.1 hypothetical protein [Pseudomonadota bacterium]
MSWKRSYPAIPEKSPLLMVSQLKCLPGRRWRFIEEASISWQAHQIKSLCRKERPIIWVQGSLDDRISERLDSVDVFSVFDDPLLNTPGNPLCEKAKLIVSQNAFADNIFHERYPQKAHIFLPPVELSERVFAKSKQEMLLPPGFPQQVMGYLGAFFPEGFDFEILRYLITSLPAWGFLMVGRTNEEGEKILWELKKFPNFCHHPWIAREQLPNVWSLLDVNLMLYRPHATNSGAFPVKLLEALYFGIPSVATKVPKTSSLEGVIPLSSFPDQIKDLALSEYKFPKDRSATFENLFYEMHPKIHLAKISELIG